MYDEKIIHNSKQLECLIATIREKPKSIVFTNGCFDVIHFGHIHYLKKSKDLGDILIVGVNSDESINRLKGENRPINCQLDRINVIAALQMIDYVYCFDDDTPIKVIDMIKPDIYTKGGDYSLDNMIGNGFGENYIKSYGGKAVIIKRIEGKSTSDIIKKMKIND